MSVFDWAALGVIVLLAAIGWARGLLKSAFGLVSFAVSYLLTWRLYPYASGFLRSAGLYGWLQRAVAGFMNLDRAGDMPFGEQAGFLSGLPLPGFLTSAITAGNNPEAYKALGVSTLGGYISGYFANAILNLIAMALVFSAVFVIMRMISGLLSFISKIPLIGAIDKLGGLALGLAGGVALVWAAMAVITIVALKPGYEGMFEQLRSGPVAGFFYANNPVMRAGVRIWG